MFTGLVADLGRVVSIDRSDDGARLAISSPLGAELAEGDSVAVNGVCLTATAVTGTGFEAEVMNQTLLVTSLGRLRPGGDVNLELPLRAADRLGGHVVQGHVDGAGEVSEVVSDGFARRIRIDVEPDLMRYLVTRGSIAVDGVSLTVAELTDRSFTVSLIPETLARTNLGGAGPGTIVNLEVDVLARYVENAVRVMAVQGGAR